MNDLFFGIAINNCDEATARDIAARLFISPRLSATHAKAIVDLFHAGKISHSKIVELCEPHIKEFRDMLLNDEDITRSMCDKLNEWTEVFEAPTDFDYAYLYEELEIDADDLFGNDREDIPADGSDINSAKELANALKQYIKGQDESIDHLAVPFYQHMDSARKGYDCPIKGSVMVMAPTGCGKSELMRQYGKISGCPIIYINCSEVRPTGWRGLHISDMIARELNNGVSVERLKYAVIILDEADKVTKHGCKIVTENGSDESYDMMRDLMKLLDVGFAINVDNGIDTSNGTPRIESIPVDNLLVVFMGAFSGIDKVIKRRLNINRTIGFGVKEQCNEQTNYMKMVTTEDLEEWGYMPELLGRISDIVVMNPLSTDDIFEIMKSAKDNIIGQHIDYAQRNNIDLNFSDDALRAIAEEAYRSGLGFRNVKALLAKVTNSLYFNNISSSGRLSSKRVDIDGEYITSKLHTQHHSQGCK